MLNKNDFYVTVPNSFYNDYDITNQELVVYCLLKRYYLKSKSVSLISIKYIADLLNVRRDKYITEIKNTINSLLDKQLILGLYDINYNPMTIDDIVNKNTLFLIEFEDLESDYFTVKDTELDRIFTYLNNTNIDKFAFTRYYIAIMRVVNNKNNFGYLTQSHVKNICGKSETIKRYNNILQEELNLIRYNNSYVTPERHNCSTYFSLYSDEVNFNNMLQTIVKEKNLVLYDKENTNKKRSTTQKINTVKTKIDNTDKDKEIAELEAKLKQLKEEKDKLYSSNKGNEKEPISAEKPQQVTEAMPSNQDIFAEFLECDEDDLLDEDTGVVIDMFKDIPEEVVREFNEPELTPREQTIYYTDAEVAQMLECDIEAIKVDKLTEFQKIQYNFKIEELVAN